MTTIFVCLKNSDTVEGKGPMIPDSAFSMESDAKDYIDDKPGLMGRKSAIGWSKEMHGDWQISPIIVFDSIEECNHYKNGEMKRNALAKLTKEERILLGLDK